MRADLSSVTWRKSTYSDDQQDCVEVAVLWRKSTYSSGQEACVEVADNIPTGAAPAVIPVRDSKNPAGPALLIPVGAWSAFVGALKAGGPR
ncbi:DUF397 domain-containing protein [Streptomyces sp. NPDC049555]|uniref:DUF397 domain-containing protein n=1 Tax=Streptomyces sp. NPDC049555 TaxID=3154930 RepID=UPI0034342A5F